VRIPPVRLGQASPRPFIPSGIKDLLLSRILLESRDFLVLNKPAGIAVHAGSGVDWGVIEALRAARPDVSRLELAHRLDRETSGCLLLAKRADALRAVHSALRAGQMDKRYLALLRGRRDAIPATIKTPLRRYTLSGGERMVQCSASGRPATTHLRVVTAFSGAVLVEARIETGRTHQIRAHAASVGTPVGGDTKYGDRDFNRQLRRLGLKRLFLHAQAMSISVGSHHVDANASLEPDLGAVLERLEDGALAEAGGELRDVPG
jgi:23S rRNA pseudouridine955/2504/2580 synthase